jgi:hypothetical protein
MDAFPRCSKPVGVGGGIGVSRPARWFPAGVNGAARAGARALAVKGDQLGAQLADSVHKGPDQFRLGALADVGSARTVQARLGARPRARRCMRSCGGGAWGTHLRAPHEPPPPPPPPRLAPYPAFGGQTGGDVTATDFAIGDFRKPIYDGAMLNKIRGMARAGSSPREIVVEMGLKTPCLRIAGFSCVRLQARQAVVGTSHQPTMAGEVAHCC